MILLQTGSPNQVTSDSNWTIIIHLTGNPWSTVNQSSSCTTSGVWFPKWCTSRILPRSNAVPQCFSISTSMRANQQIIFSHSKLIKTSWFIIHHHHHLSITSSTINLRLALLAPKHLTAAIDWEVWTMRFTPYPTVRSSWNDGTPNHLSNLTRPQA